MATANCGTCHALGDNGTTFHSSRNMDHTGATACSSCHSYNAARWSNPGSPTFSSHVMTSTECSSCHAGTAVWSNGSFDHQANGIFTGSNCYSGCHDGSHSPALPRNAKHVYAPMTNSTCGSCHTSYTTFAGKGTGWNMDHTGATLCSGCHSYSVNTNAWTNGATKSQPIAGHPVTSAQCSTCHTMAPGWAGAIVHNYNLAAQDCFSNCHNGTGGTAAPVSGTSAHTVAPMTNHTCGTCHAGQGVSWTTPLALPGSMNSHSGAIACSSCHSYSIAKWSHPGSPTYPTHLTATGTQCSNCHASTAIWSGGTVSHSAYTASTTCQTGGCHNGSNGSAMPTSGTSGHLGSMVNSQCGTCHSGIGTSWTAPLALPSSMNGHAGTAGQCATCHSYLSAKWSHPGSPTYTGHMSVAGSCDSGGCHTSAATTLTWTGVTFNHVRTPAITVATDCTTCHNGVNATGLPASGKSVHLAAPMSGNNYCGTCHTISTSAGISFGSPAPVMNHSSATACATCHSYSTAMWTHPGSPTYAPHVNTTAYQCSACHRTTVWTPPTFAHSGVTTGCASCHKTGFATAPSVTHFITAQACEKCHTTTVWSPIKAYSHVSPYYKVHTGPNMTVYADCKLCHITNNEVISGAPHKGSATYSSLKQCAWCHSQQFKSSAHIKQQATAPTTYYTVTELQDCSGACHIYTSTAFTTIKTNRTGHHHSTDGGF